jgi:hypothetical protein
LLAGLAASAAAQGPEADWRSVETPHFRVHYPAASEAWSLRLAARLESVREAVGREVGYTPAQRIDVVVADPAATANGSAWPLLSSPRVVLWTTPPEAGSSLAHLADWGELVAVHEMAHLAHLLRPSRQPFRALLERTLWPLAPLATKAPRWATEGYATLVEGRLTGSGRPHSALRASVVRVWGRAGRLPGYAQLADDRDSFLGSSMAYLVGSAFLEWAERRSGDPRALTRLWAAATARQDRGFDEAWERVFGEAPRVAYARFVAETAADAVAAERQLGDDAREGEIWLERRWSTGEPEVSRDGHELAAILREREAPARLVVWSLAEPAPAAASKSRLPADPDDPARAPIPPRRRAAARTLEEPAGRELLAARFFADGRRLLVTLLAPDRRGVEHADLYLWQENGKLTRLTRGADLRDADPAPDGRRAIAVRWRDGASQLVEVDLGSGFATPLGGARIDVVHDSPRLAPDGASLAWLEHRDGKWRSMVAPYSPASGLGPARELVPGDGGEPTHLAWRGDGSLVYAAIARGEAIEIEALAATAGATSHRVTRSGGANFAPAPTPDGKWLFYLSLAPDGIDLRRLDLDAATVQEVPPTTATADADLPAASPFAPTAVGAPRRYGLGRGQTQAIVGGWAGSEPGSLELGARAGDLLGRWELLALAGVAGDEGRRGGALRATLQLLPIALELDLARLRLAEREATAVRIAATRDDTFGAGDLRWRAAAGWSRWSPATRDLTVAQLGFDAGLAAQRGRLSLTTRLAAETTSALAPSGSLHRLRLGIRLAHPAASLAVGATTWRANRRAPPELAPTLGGMPSSLAPPTLEPGRIDLPALPAAALSGRRLDLFELRATAKRLPATIVLQRFRVEGDDGARSEIHLAGFEKSWKLPPMPLVGLPAAEARLGVARLSGDLGERATRWWIGIVFPLPR